MSDDLPALGQAAYLRPGDTLVLTFSRPITAQHADVIKQRFGDRLPNNQIVIVDNCTAAIVAPADSGIRTRTD